VVVDWSHDQNHANKCQRFFVDTTGPVHQFTVSPLVDCPTYRLVKHYREYKDAVQMKLGLGCCT